MRLLSISLFVLCITLKGFSQEASFTVRNFTTKNYGRDFHPSNLSVFQDNRGIIYAANGFKLLEFDGRNWNSYPINKETWILSVAADTTGIIFVGSQTEFGFFIPDLKGNLVYSSLSDSLEIEDLDFTNIWKVHSFSGGIAFQSEEILFVCRNGKIKAVRPATSFHTSFVVNNDLYIRERGTGILKWDNDSLLHVPGSEIFDTTGIFMMSPFGKDNRQILIGTRGKGFWKFDPDTPANNFKRFRVEDESFLEQSRITDGILTDNGLFAIGTMLNGLILIDPEGRTITKLDKDKGLADNDIKQIISDHSGNLWLATNNGISTVEISSPLSFFSESSGLSGSISSVIRFRGTLYVGTSSGLFRQNMSTGGTAFSIALSLSVPVRCITEAEGSLFIGTDNGLYETNGMEIKKLDDKISYSVYYSPTNRLLFSAGSKGITVFKNKGIFRKTDLLKEINEDIIGIAGDNSATDSVTIWLGTRYNGVLRLKIIKDLTLKYEYYNSADGIPGGPVSPFRIEDRTIFSTSGGLYEFIDENIVKNSLPDSLRNNKDFLKGYFSAFSLSDQDDAKTVSFIAEDSSRLWISSDNHAAWFDKTQKKYNHQPFAGIDVGKINTIYPERDICWMGTTDGLIMYNMRSSKSYETDSYCLIRKISLTNNDSTIFNGSFYLPGRGIVRDQPQNFQPVISFNNNSIRFEFSDPFYEYTDKILYSYQLNDSRWTSWDKENFQEFTNLREGSYVFRVKAMNVYGKESTITKYNFTVLPPWYRSVMAYIFYALSGILLIWLVSWLNSYRLKRENIRLEGIVTERTAEVVLQRDEIEKKNTILEYQNKEIEDSIRYAKRIQSAVIPSEDLCLEMLPEGFIFFRPLNIVSGDFYWISKVENKIIFTAADCTGHGVPGAFMSMLGVAFLNEIVDKDRITEPDIILNMMRKKVIQSLQHRGSTNEARDGMDISLVSIDLKDHKLQYAGAYNPLIMIRNNELTEMSGDKMPVGTYEKMDPFTKHEIKIEKGDVFYLASDGYEDQFGGPDGKKFKSKKFKQMLIEIHKLPMNEQKDIIEKRFEEWKGDLKQIDDVVVAGIMIT